MAYTLKAVQRLIPLAALASASGLIWTPQPIAEAGAAVSSVVIVDGPRVQFQRTLQYQATAFCPQPPTVVVTPTIEWLKPFDGPPQRRSIARVQQPALIPPPVADQTVGGWLKRFERARPPRSIIRVQQQPFFFTPPVGDNNVVGGGFYSQWQASPPKTRPPLAASELRQFGVPGERLGIEWLQPFGRALTTSSPNQQIAWCPQEVAAVVSNLTNTLEWLQPFGRALPTPGPTQSAAWCPQEVAQAAAPSITDPFVSVDGPRVNFLRTLQYQASAWCPQPIAAVVVTATIDWLPSWEGPPNYNPAPAGGSPFVPREAVLENTVTPDKWLQAFRAPPRYWPVKVQTPPFVPREAVLENTVTPDKWLIAFRGAPATRPAHTQPFYGFPYIAASNLTSTLEWMQAWQGPPRYSPPSILAEPFVPREAVLENTVTPDKWLSSFYNAVPRPPVWVTQPFYGFPYVSAPTVTTTLEWMQAFKGPPRYRPIKTQVTYPVQPVAAAAFSVFNVHTSYLIKRGFFYQATIYAYPPPAAVDNTVTIDKWQQPLGRTPRATARLYLPGQAFLPRAAVLENTVTPDKWLFRFQKAAPARPVHRTQPFFGYPYFQTDTCVGAFDLAFQSDAFQVCRQEIKGWFMPLSQPVPPRPVYRTQPFYGFPYLALPDNTVTPDKWLQAWKGPPRYWPIKVQTPPFVPAEATRENTVTPDKWLVRFPRQSGPAKRPRYTQPFYGFPYVQPVNLTSTLEWLEAWRGPPRIWPRPTQPAWSPQFIVQLAVIIPVCAHTEIVFPTATVEVVFHTTDTEVLFPTSETTPEECPD